MERLKSFDEDEGKSEEMSELAQDFAERLRLTQAKCEKQRDDVIAQLIDVKQQEREYRREISRFLRDETTLEELEASGSINNVISGDVSVPTLSDSSAFHERASDTPSGGGDVKLQLSSRSDRHSNSHSILPDVTSSHRQHSFRSDSVQSGHAISGREKEHDASKESSVDTNASNDPQFLSEQMFRATLRSGVDDVAPFNFDLDRDSLDLSSSTVEQGAVVGGEHRSARRKRLMKGVAQSKLTLKPIVLKKRPPSSASCNSPP